jgi:hypothetical protein
VSFLVENPLYIIGLGIITCLTPLLLWSHTGSTAWLRLLLGCVVFFAAWLAFERWYETDRESLHRTVYHYRDLVRDNKIDELLQHVHPDLRSRVGGRLNKYHFLNCNVSQVSQKPTIKVQAGQTTADLEFLSSATVREFGSGGPIRIRLKLEKLGPGKWLVVEVQSAMMGANQPFVDFLDHL